MSTLTYILGWPLLAAVVLAFVPRNYRFVMRLVALGATAISALLAIKMFLLFPGAEANADGYRFVQQIPWVESLGISYFVGVDGINVGLVLMGAIVAFAAACCAWEIKQREKEFYILLLVMTGGILAAFASLDLFFFYFFHQLFYWVLSRALLGQQIDFEVPRTLVLSMLNAVVALSVFHFLDKLKERN